MILDGDIEDGDGIRAWRPFASSAAVVLVNGDGEKTLTARFRDRAGNEAEASAIVRLLTTAPVVAPALASPWAVARVKNGDAAVVSGTITAESSVAAARLLSLDAGGQVLAGSACVVEVAGVAVSGTSLSGTVSISTCAGAAGVALEVIAQNAAGARSIAEESRSNPLEVDNVPPGAPTAVLLVEPPARAGHTRSRSVSLSVSATEPDGIVEMHLSGALEPAPRVEEWVPLPASGVEVVTLTAGDGEKLFEIRFRDAVRNETAVLQRSVQLDTAPPAAPEAAVMRLVQASAAPFDPDATAETNDSFALDGIAATGRLEVHAAVPDLSTEPPATRVALIDLGGAGAFDPIPLPYLQTKRWYAVAIDDAGNRSSPTTLALPRLTDLVATPEGVGPTGDRFNEPLVVRVTTDASGPVGTTTTALLEGRDATFGVPPTVVTNPDGTRTLTFELYASESDRSYPERAVVRVFQAAPGLANGSVATAALPVILDVTPPELDPGSIALLEARPGEPDMLVGAFGAATDNYHAPTDLWLFVYEADTYRYLYDGAPSFDGSFGPIPLGDNEVRRVRVALLDPSQNESQGLVFENDIDAPVIRALEASPAALPDGGQLLVRFEVEDAKDLFQVPTVTLEGQPLSLVSGSLDTSNGTRAFVYQRVVDSSAHTDGARTLRVVAVDAVGNAAEATATVTLDFTPPESELLVPSAASWNGQLRLLGRAFDADSGVAKVHVALLSQAGGTWWNPATNQFDAAAPVFVVANGTTSWHLDVGGVPFVGGSGYEVRHRAEDGVGNLEPPRSFVFTFTPFVVPAPAALAARPLGEATIEIAWNANAPAPDAYLLYYGLSGSGGFGGKSAEVGDSPLLVVGDAVDVTLTGLPAGRYDFALTAVEGGRESAFSNVATASSRYWRWREPPLGAATISAAASPAPGIAVFVGSGSTLHRFVDGILAPTAFPGVGAFTNLHVGAGFVVAGGAPNHVVVSFDQGASWERKERPWEIPFNGIAVEAWWSEGSLLLGAGGAGYVWRSTDGGATFTGVPTTTQQQLRAIAGSGQHVVVFPYNGGDFSYSQDGGATFSTSIPPPTSQWMSAAVSSGTVVVVIGEAGVMYRTPDVTRLETAPFAVVPSDTSVQLVSIAVGPNGEDFIAGDAAGNVLVSRDRGASWARKHNLGRAALGVHATETHLVAVGSGPDEQGPAVVAISADGGETWMQPTGTPNGQLQAVVFDGTRFLAMGRGSALGVGEPGDTAWRSLSAARATDLETVAIASSYIVAAGRSGTVLTSHDEGETWQVRSSGTSEDLVSSHAFGDEVVLVGTAGAVVTSSDGLAFTPRASGTSARLNAVFRSGPVVLAVGDGGAAVRSANGGLSFQPVTTGLAAKLRGVFGRDNVWVVAGNDGALATSTNGGQSFTNRSVASNIHLFHASGIGGRLLAAGTNSAFGPDFGSAGYLLVSEDDGASFRNTAYPGWGVARLAGGGGRLFAAGKNRVGVSEDGGDTFAFFDIQPPFFDGGYVSVLGLGADEGIAVVVMDQMSNRGTTFASYDEGLTFEPPARPLPAPLAGTLVDVVASDGLAVAVGYDGAIVVFGPR